MDPKEFYELLAAVHASTRQDDEALEGLLHLVGTAVDPGLSAPNRLGLWHAFRRFLQDHGYPLT